MGAHDLIEIVGADAGMFIINQTATSTPVKFGAPTTFTIIFAPTSDGAKSATISIPNNDSDEDPYEFTITGTGFYEPEINVTDIQRRDIPSGSGSFDFGTTAIGRSDFSIFFIENHGKAPLMLSNVPPVTISGSGASVFDVVAQPSSSIISPGSLRLFLIAFRPTARQEYSATVSIGNNDSDENPYTFTIKGKGGAPEINVKDSGAKDIPSGTGNFNFEAIEFDQTDDETFTIENLGEYILNITGNPRISITGPGASVFSVTADASPSVSAGLSTTFTIQFKPNGVDKFQATVSIANDDSDKNPYTFTIFGRSKFKKSDSDFNGDGYPDIAVNAYMADGLDTNSGVVYIYFGKPNWNASYTTDDADVTIKGLHVNDRVARSVFVGDLNNDGFDDLVIGQIYDNNSVKKSGQAYVFFGSPDPPDTMKVTDCDVHLTGESAGDGFGYKEIMVGDINGDSISDLMIGAVHDDDAGSDCGCVFVFFGREGWDPEISASEADVKLIGEAGGDRFGDYICAEGDINKDGIDDLIVEAIRSNATKSSACYVYIFFGRQAWNPTVSAVDADVIIIGDDKGDLFGRTISMSGDVNNDGISDIVLGAMQADNTNGRTGNVYIFFGRSSWSSQYTASQADVVIEGEFPSGGFGLVLTANADLNKDGISDIVIGAPLDAVGGALSGAVYIFFGRTNWSSTIGQKSADMVIECYQERSRFGNDGCTSDIDQDGYVDIIVGAPIADGSKRSAGAVYIFFGSQNWSSLIDVKNCDVKLLGKDINDNFGSNVSSN